MSYDRGESPSLLSYYFEVQEQEFSIYGDQEPLIQKQSNKIVWNVEINDFAYFPSWLSVIKGLSITTLNTIVVLNK